MLRLKSSSKHEWLQISREAVSGVARAENVRHRHVARLTF